MISHSASADVYTDFKGLAELRQKAKGKSPEALRETAKQFESLFLQMTLKSMRSATQQSGLLDSDQSKMYRDLYDQQLSLELGKRSKLGLADMMVKQLGGDAAPGAATPPGKTLEEYRNGAGLPPIPLGSGDIPANVQAALRVNRSAATTAVTGPTEMKPGSPEEFVNALWPHAQAAAAELGVDPKMLLAQAALESGWGKNMVHGSDGSSSKNLFGIKADASWAGRSIATRTLEHENGAPVSKRAAFRAYDSYADSFRDYVGFLRDNPRYSKALQHSDNPVRFIAGLQKAGYATDPSYARKVLSIYQGNSALAALG